MILMNLGLLTFQFIIGCYIFDGRTEAHVRTMYGIITYYNSWDETIC